MSAAWLREQLLETAASLYPDRTAVMVREWADPVRLREPEPVGYRFLFLLAVGGDNPPPSPDFDDVLAAFAHGGWQTYRHECPSEPDEYRATASREGFEVRVYAGAGAGILTFTGWTPVVFTARQLPQPLLTRSTANGPLCQDCYGWGVCLECGGTAHNRDASQWGRCWCAAGNSGPGRCIECRGTGLETSCVGARNPGSAPVSESADAYRQPSVETGHDSNVEAFIDVSRRNCDCGDFRCSWRNILVEADDHLVSQFIGSCQGCAEQRAYAFALPYRRLPPPTDPPSPPPCPRCGAMPVPLIGGLHFPGSPMMRAQELGLVAFDGRGWEVRPHEPNWRCPSCGHDWRDDDQRRRQRTLDALLADIADD